MSTTGNHRTQLASTATAASRVSFAISEGAMKVAVKILT